MEGWYESLTHFPENWMIIKNDFNIVPVTVNLNVILKKTEKANNQNNISFNQGSVIENLILYTLYMYKKYSPSKKPVTVPVCTLYRYINW